METFLTRSLTLGTRGSPLARWQTDHVIRRLHILWPALNSRTKLFTTSGDRNLDKPLPEIGGKGLFTEELENAICSGEIDAAVHSLKDLPIDDTPGLTLGAICEREDARDVLISRDPRPLSDLPRGARVGTASLRRAAQLLATRPDLAVLPVRGNVDTRIRKARSGDYDAIVLAAAGVLRLDLNEHITEYLPFEVMLPAPGQGAMAVQCRADDSTTRELLAAIEHAPTRIAVTAERAFLNSLGGGCSAPVAAYAVFDSQSFITMTGLVAARDGRRVIRVSGEGHDPNALGAELAQQALAQGAEELLG
ncbi:MAG TPA: hydroxymethylbilane synthase [Anaerolineales bacterium]|nr:hydroxymethylbilane synthase [Anaerolineales bacterium]